MPPENDDSTNVTPETPAPNAEADLNNRLNGIVTAHLKRFTEKQLPSMFEAALKPLHEKLAAPPAHAEEESKSKSKDKQTPEMAALLAQVEDMKAKMTAAETARASAEQKQRDDGARGALKDALSAHVRPELLNILTDHLFHQKKVVEFDDDGSPLFRSKKTDVFGGEEDVRMPLKAGIEQFLKTDEAKPFIPAPGSAQSSPLKKPSVTGGRQTAFDPATATTAEKIRQAMEITARAEAKSGG